MREFSEIYDEVAEASAKTDVDRLTLLSKELAQHSDPRAAGAVGSINGHVYSYQGENEKALESYKRSVEIFHELGEKREESQSLNNMGTLYGAIGDYEAAGSLFRKALMLSEEVGNQIGAARALANIGLTHSLRGEYPEAIEATQRAHQIFKESDQKQGVFTSLSTLGQVHSAIGDYPTAISYFQRSMKKALEIENKHSQATVLVNIGQVYNSMLDYESALAKFEQSRSLFEDLNEPHGLAAVDSNVGIILMSKGEYASALERLDNSLSLFKQLKDKESVALVMGSIASTNLAMGNVDIAASIIDEQARMSVTDNKVKIEIVANRAKLAELRGDLEEATRLYVESIEISRETKQRPLELQLYKRIRDLQLKREDLGKYVEYNDKYTRLTDEISGKEAAQKIAVLESEQKLDVERQEREKERALLYGALPKAVADRMLKGEDVSGDKHEDVTVLFADIVGFTAHTNKSSPQETTSLLASVYETFDAICDRFGITKIKTIGDSYMAVGFDVTHITQAASAALEMTATRFVWPDGTPLQFRVGLHCGPVVAGVIGKQRLQYDVWGDTVNTASRMESSGEAGRIHCSEAFASSIPHPVASGDTPLQGGEGNTKAVIPGACPRNVVTGISRRGTVDIKGKGTMTTYWLEGA